MSCNNNKPHLHIYSEDAATHDVANGFYLAKTNSPLRQIQVLPYGSGWSDVMT